MDIWFVGTVIDEKRWMVEGAFLSEKEAKTAAKFNEFILLAELGRLPVNATDAKKIYWPHQETWEQSALYKRRTPD
jgi:hypothetical protein